MSLLLAGLVFAGTSGALMVGRWFARRRGDVDTPDARDRPPAEDDDEARGRAAAEAEAPSSSDEDPATGRAAAKDKRVTKRAARAPERPLLDGFVCQLGDVLMRITGEEAWLAGGLVLSEEMPVAVLYVAPDAGHDCAIYARVRPRDSVYWLEPLDPSAILVGGEPPSSVEQGGVRFERARRLPLRPQRIGVGAPDVGDAVVVAEYTSAGAERLLVLKASTGIVRAYRGLELEEGSFEVIASGASTLES